MGGSQFNYISVARALVELKLLDKRVSKRVNEGVYLGYKVGNKVGSGFESEEELIKTIQSDYDSVKDLIERRNKIKSKIVESNANTKVEVSGRAMTVAEAIERKQSIGYEGSLLNRLVASLAQQEAIIDAKNEESKERLDGHLKTIYGNQVDSLSKEVEKTVEFFKKENDAVLVDPLNLRDVINKLSEEIESFRAEVDHVLTESNVKTIIEIEV